MHGLRRRLRGVGGQALLPPLRRGAGQGHGRLDPNFSLRMHEGTAAMLRPQIKTIGAPREYNERYYRIAAQLNYRAAPSRTSCRRLPSWGLGPVQRRGHGTR